MSTAEYNKVALGGQTSTTSYNIPENKRNVVSYNICSVKKFNRDQTSYNKIQHDETRYNNVAKRVQHFIQHRSCMMLYEMLYSFGRGFSLLFCNSKFFIENMLSIIKMQLLSVLFSVTNSTCKHTLLMLLTVTSHDLETRSTSF